MDIFESASRLKLRFKTNRGLIATEDLWDMPLKSKSGFDLDTAAKVLNKEIKLKDEESFVEPRSSETTELELAFEIVKHVIKTKQEENRAKTEARAKETKREKIREILMAKEDESLKNKSPEELKKMLEDL